MGRCRDNDGEMKMKKIILPVLMYVAILLCIPLAAQETLNDKAFIIVLENRSVGEAGDEGRRFAETIAASVSAAFREKGLKTQGQKTVQTKTDKTVPESDLAAAAGKEAGVRNVIFISSLLDNQRLSWRIGIYDAENTTLIAADAFSAYAGLSALAIIDDSSQNVAQSWKKNRDAPVEIAVMVETSQKFISKDSGVSIRYGSLESGTFREAGTVIEGKLTADYTPFSEGAPIFLEVYREGYWTKELVLPKGVREKPFKLPRLQKITDSAWGWSTGLGRLLGAAVTYRWYPLPDRVFLKAENSFWAATDFKPGSSPVLHDELRLGAGVYLQKEHDAIFRYAAGAGFSGIATWLTGAPGYDVPAGLDFTLEPLWFTLEYHFPTWAIVFEERIPYSLGADSGFLEKGWLTLGGKSPTFFSLGVLYKW